MMNTLAYRYCAMCEAVAEYANKFLTSMINTFEAIGRARASAELSRQGYHAEAKALMTDDKNN